MVLGIPLVIFTLLHVVISLAGIASGFIVMVGLLTGKMMDRWTALFLATTILTSLTGYLFPFHQLLPSHIVGGISLLVLTTAIVARYAQGLAGPWRWVYVVNAMAGLYLNVFVLIVQSFRRVTALTSLAPTGTEATFKIVQSIVLGAFFALTTIAVKKFRTSAAHGSAAQGGPSVH